MLARLILIASLAASAVAAVLPAAASTITEDDVQFSRHWKNPTEIGFGADTILGTAEKQNGHEFIVLTGLTPGAQTLEFAFAVPDWALSSDSFSAGGQVLWSEDPFRHAWDGTFAGSFQLGRWSPRGTLSLALGEEFSGPLYLGIYFTHGSDVTWSLSAPGNAADNQLVDAPSSVPLPAAMWPMLGGMAVLAALGRRMVVANGSTST
jgi:hypothetical protein